MGGSGGGVGRALRAPARQPRPLWCKPTLQLRAPTPSTRAHPGTTHSVGTCIVLAKGHLQRPTAEALPMPHTGLLARPAHVRARRRRPAHPRQPSPNPLSRPDLPHHGCPHHDRPPRRPRGRWPRCCAGAPVSRARHRVLVRYCQRQVRGHQPVRRGAESDSCLHRPAWAGHVRRGRRGWGVRRERAGQRVAGGSGHAIAARRPP